MASKEYRRVLRIFTDLTVNGIRTPEEQRPKTSTHLSGISKVWSLMLLGYAFPK
jgi:hypothetical protein